MKIHTLKRTCWIAIVISVISLILTAINIWAYIKNKWYLLLYSLNLESLGEGNFIFVGGGTDEWAANVPSECVHPSRRILVVTHDTTLLSPSR
ncbi:hypothetical protein NXY30_27495 [Bacteroides faecis]|uniref:Uncharacterized protein n=1 Tax=Bacteroides faecis TaxID=674529 RepID=A0ABY5T9T3_9BACE|nr:hypothetical protein [Bacteroides faecis]UVQ74633.1 hypothetical protein NXY30_27495 [Bacteroides faecis]